jgi:beta-N-acetylhexosaminidase
MKYLLIFAFVGLLITGFFYQTAQQASKEPPRSGHQTAPLREKVASLLILHTPGTDPEKAAAFIKKYRPAGLIIMDDNINQQNLDRLKELTQAVQQASSPYPSLIAIDQEGCSVKRIKSDLLPCAEDLKTKPTTETKEAFQKRAILLKQHGVNLNFGLVADITEDKDSFIYPRVFGSTPDEVAGHIMAAVDGEQTHVFSTLKHFPGHGRTSADSHTSVPEVAIDEVAWMQTDAIPFVQGISSNAEFVMFGHLIYRSVDTSPATLSKIWHEKLSQDLGFKGIMITDDMIMLQKSEVEEYSDIVKNAVAALNAGNHIILYVNEYNLEEEPIRHIDIDALITGIEEAVKSGDLKESVINANVEKVNELRSRLTQR